MVTSPKQIESNRENAQKSTGPRTEEGKSRSSQNAITHGLTAQQVIIDGEDPEAFELLRDELHAHYAPQLALEASFVELLAGQIWRALRIPMLEAAVLKALLQEEERVQGEQELREEGKFRRYVDYDPLRIDLGAGPGILPLLRKEELKRIAEYGQLAGLHIGHALIRDARLDDVMAKLERHELYLLNGIERTMRILESLQGHRTEQSSVNNVVDVQPDAA